MLNKLAEIANNLDQSGKYAEADKITSLMVKLSQSEKKEKSLVNKIIDLLEKEGLKCPECNGEMEFEPGSDNYGLCNCSDEDCDCTIDLVEEVEEFLHKLDEGEFKCPDCEGEMKLKGADCICTNGKCKCKMQAKKMFLSDLFDGMESDKEAGMRIASRSHDHEFSMARKQLMSAKHAIEHILEAMGDKEEGDLMAWVQSYLTMASDYLQSVQNYMSYGSADLLDEEDGLDDIFDFEDENDEAMRENEFEDEFRIAAKKPGNVRLNKPFRTPGGPKKFSVYVKNKKGNIVKVNFGDPGLSIKRDDPNRRRNFRARHNCDSDPRAKDRTTAKYWSCKFWSSPSVTSLLKG